MPFYGEAGQPWAQDDFRERFYAPEAVASREARRPEAQARMPALVAELERELLAVAAR
ncbi:hypothetical protein GCM10023144_00520 [Pigmentiphaga soli]|uniref:Uncharacterized protein n=1 Tax=Pigmentiphaga soli TaxID=1007095 RepID=A0ABP8GBP7_9BURK